MTELNLDYEQDTAIDEQALDVEWLQQSDLMRKYCSHAAATKERMDALKERLEVEKARLDLDIRKIPHNYGIEGRVTESVVASTILLQPSYQEVMDQYRQARYENDIAVAAVRAIDQKKTALENLVKLLGQNYFSGPSAPRDISKEWVGKQKQRRSNSKVKLTRQRGQE